MAEMMEGGGGHDKKGKKKGKKGAPRVDMTPMVDLGFLLITFFMLTTTMSKPQAMELNMPDKTNEPVKDQLVKASQTLTVILGKNDKLYYHMGTIKDVEEGQYPVEQSDFSSQGIRKVILQKKAELGVDDKGIPKLIVVIKAMDEAKYRAMVDILDEMHITEAKRYAIVQIIPEDVAFIEKHFPGSTI